MKIAGIALLSLAMMAFAWSIPAHFRRAPRTGIGMRIMTVGGLFFFGAQIIAALASRPASPKFGAFVFFWALSMALFSWALAVTRSLRLYLAFSEPAPDRLLEEGPFRYVRHPFYLSYSLYWLAGAILGWPHILPALAVPVMGSLYVNAALREERQFEEGTLKSKYLDYKKRAGMFLPKMP